MSEGTFVGVDLSRDRLDVFCLPQNKTLQFPNTPKGRKALVKAMLKCNAQLVVMEATGGLELPVALALHAAGIACVWLNPRLMRHYARSLGKEAKTDAIDAQVLAHYAAERRPRPQCPPSEKELQLQALARRHRQLVKILVAEKNHLSSEPDAKVRALIEQTIQGVQTQLAQVDEAIEHLVEDDEQWRQKRQLLTSVKGVGKQTAQVLLADLPELGTLSRKQAALLVGLAPLNDDSGRRSAPRRIRGGRTEVRNAIYIAALVASRFNHKIKTFYENLLAKGKPKKLALIACARKLLIMLNSILKNNRPFEAKTA